MPSPSRIEARPPRAAGRLPRIAAALALAAGLMLSTTHAFAQATGSIRGQVTDAMTGRPVVGAQVHIPGTSRGSLTNATGAFLMVGVPAGQHTLRVDYLGYRAEEATVTVAAEQVASVNFELRPAAIDLEQIVVTGTAGETQKKALGNTVSTISAAEITDVAPVSNIQQLLQARAPGLTIMSNAGQAGASSKFRIRGAGSLNANLEPVFYIDGVRVMSGTQDGYATGNGVVQGTNALNALNPNDIERIEVIKGPAASTLYGAEAAGGVIQIFTKKGRQGQGIEWTIGTEAGQQEWALDRITTYWLCEASHIADSDTYPGCAGMDPNAPGEQRLLTDKPLDRDIAAENTAELGAACRWVPNCRSPNALRTGDLWGVNLSARGGGESYNFYLSAEKSDEQGVFYNNFARRTGGRANFGFVPTEDLNFTVNVGYTRNHIMMPLNNNSSNSVLRNSFRGRPGLSAPWAEGFRGFSPEISNEYDNQTFEERTTIGLTANYQPFSWFQNRLTLGMDNNDRLNQDFYAIDVTGREPWGDIEATGAIYQYLPTDHVWTLDYAGTVSNELTNDLSSAFSGGLQLNARRREWREVHGEGLVANKLNLVSAAAVTRARQGFEEQTSMGFFFQEMLGWKDRLFVTGAVRVDDNSAFGNNFSLVVYPKASLAYVISEEPFFEDVVPHLDELKLRFAWGQAGNAPEPFSADRTFAPTITTVGDAPVNRLAFSEYGNPDLKAETGQEFEAGFDASGFDGRLGAEFTYYYQQTKDALISVPDPRSTGFGGSHLINIGEIRNSGLELQFTGTPVYGRNLVWDATLSLSTNSNELVSFGRDANGNPIRDEISFGAFATVQKHREGYPLGGYWSLDVQRDASGNPVLDSRGRAIVLPDDSMQYVGPMLPTREIGFTNTLTLFGDLQLFATVDYKGGNYQWCAICSIRNRIDRNTFEVNDPNGTPEQKAVYLSLQTKTYIMPADFVKLRDLSATYSLRPEWISRFGAERASITLSGRNLWMWTKYEGTSDPEVTFYSRSNFNHLDYASAPMLRRLVASMRVQF